jgi:hypothetical protein
MSGVVLFRTGLLPYVDGDHLAALMLSQILYWFEPSKDGGSKLRVYKQNGLFLVKSHVDWETELGMSRRQSQRCLDLLRSKGFIKTEVHRFKSTPTLHIQLLVDPLNAPASAIPSAPASANVLHAQVQPLTETTAKTTTEITNESEVKVSAEDVLKKFQNQQPVKAGDGVNQLVLLWKKHLGLTSNGFVHMTAKQIGQLKHVHKALPGSAWSVLSYCLNNWQEFAHEVSAKKAISPCLAPDTGWFLAHYPVAIQMMTEPPKPKNVQSIAPVVVQTQKPVENADIAGEDDIMDTLAQLAKIKAEKG